MLWNYFFIPPQYTLAIGKLHDVTMFLMFFVVAIAIGHLTTRLRASEIAVQKRERRTSALLELARQAALAPELNAGLDAAVKLIENLLHHRVALTLRAPDRTLSTDSHPAGTLRLSEKERSVAAWVYGRGTPAGRFTDTLTDADAMHLPLQARTGIWGVLSIKPLDGRPYRLDERDLLEALAGLTAAILEKDHFIQAFKQAEVFEASEQLRRALFESIPHELKTPLATLRTGVDTLLFLTKPQAGAARRSC